MKGQSKIRASFPCVELVLIVLLGSFAVPHPTRANDEFGPLIEPGSSAPPGTVRDPSPETSELPPARRSAASATLSKPEFTEIQHLSGGEILVKLRAPANANTRLEISANLVDWISIATLPQSAAVLEHTDSAARYLPYRYYRAAQVTATNVVTGDHLVTADGDVILHPINHATFVMAWKGKIIYADPVGGASRFQGLPRPDLILITDIHSDHLDANTLNLVGAKNADIVAPQAVFQQLSSDLRAKTKVLANGETFEVQGLLIDAIPMYNTTSGRLTYHTKGRGNGYVLTIGGKRIYIAGDTEDIPEMRALKGIDVAFICMNLPFTMEVNQASSAVREFRPKVVYPFHFSGSDVNQFKQAVGTDLGVEVRLRKWY